MKTILILQLVMVTAATTASQNEGQRIRQMIEKQQKDWNRGDIRAFMEGYEKSDALVFTTGGKVWRGWNDALGRYRESYPDRDAMGELEFSDLEISILGDSAAVVLGKWALARKNDRPRGVFSLVLRKGPKGWKIIHDHTSGSR